MQNECEFATDRLVVRRWVPADEARISGLYGDAEIVRWVDDGTPLSASDARRWMSVTRENYATRGYGMWAVDLRATSETIGFGGIVHPGGQPEAEVKYAFERAAWHRGYATEFVRGLVRHAWSVLGLRRLEASIDPANTASVRVLEKSGFLPPRSAGGDVENRIVTYALQAP